MTQKQQQQGAIARPGGAKAPVDTASSTPPEKRGSAVKALGFGVISGAADNDPSAIGTYASAGAKFGFGSLWAMPIILPMMFTVV